jgi:dGTPase
MKLEEDGELGGERPDLAPYAARSACSRGREHPEAFKDARPVFERDRDRVIHSAAFRRLEYKTQVFVNHEGDYYRTRLTHSLEVAQIARGLARRLGLNEELAEALSLAHDLGHTPFGHTGEETLNRLMAGAGGFEHNLQSLRVVTLLEERYPGFPGLNLSWEVREGIVKHRSSWDVGLETLDEYEPGLQPTLEAQLIDLADEIAYNNHDIDDGWEAGYLHLDELMEVEFWREAWERVQGRSGDATGRRAVYQTISDLIGWMMGDLIRSSRAALREAGVETLEEVRRAGGRLVCRSPEMEEKNRLLQRFLHEKLYRHPKVETMRLKAQRLISELFEAYTQSPGLLEEPVRARAERHGLERAACDYIAGMTDRSCIEEHRRLFDPYHKA